MWISAVSVDLYIAATEAAFIVGTIRDFDLASLREQIPYVFKERLNCYDAIRICSRLNAREKLTVKILKIVHP